MHYCIIHAQNEREQWILCTLSSQVSVSVLSRAASLLCGLQCTDGYFYLQSFFLTLILCMTLKCKESVKGHFFPSSEVNKYLFS